MRPPRSLLAPLLAALLFAGCATPQDPSEMAAFLDAAATSTSDFYVNSLVIELRRKLGTWSAPGTRR